MSRQLRTCLRRPRLHIAICLGLVLAQTAWAQAPPQRAARGADADAPVASTALPDAWVAQLRWRSIGPAAMGGRITALAVYEADPSIWWVATASGGLLKTTNNGVSFEHQFEHEATVSLGDVAVFQGDPNVVWVGTGESNPRNSVSWGDGVYKSTDGGKTWKNMGLRGIFQTGRVLIHPTDPNIVYVAGMGRLWGENEERGVFKTTDGGATWEKVLYVDSKTGAITLAFKPDDPDTLLAAMWERQRDGFDTNTPIKPWGPGSGLYKSTDAGKTWRRITAGLPQESHIGRIGVDFYRKDPNVVYMVLESERSGLEPENAAYLGVRGEDADVGARITDVTKDSPADAAGLKTGDIVISANGSAILSYNELQRELRKRVAGDSLDLTVSRERTSVLINATLSRKPNATSQPARRGPSEAVSDNRPFGAMLGGQQPNVHDQQGPDGHEYGGVYRSDDAGDTWRRINSVNPRPMYFSKVRVDPADNSYLWVLGVDLHRSSNGGETFSGDGARDAHPDHHALWIDPRDGRHAILGNDGGVYVTYDRGERWDHLNHTAIGQFYHVTVDPRPNYNVYGGLQDNGSWGGPSRVRHNRGPLNFDWFRVGGGDGFVCRVDAEDPDQVYFTSQNGGLGRINLRTGERASIRPERTGGTRLRWNWETPFILSHHNSRIFYTAANYVFRSLNRGRDLKRISPEITFTRRGSATDLSESPLDSDVLYVGSDDGALHGTRDGGKTWTLLNEFSPDKMPAIDAAPDQAAPDAAAETSPDADAPPAATPAAPPREEAPERPTRAERREPPAGQRGPGRGGAGRMLERLAELDANKDGMIQRDEVPENMQRLFDRADSNQDGVIDAAELETMRERMQQFGAARREQREAGAEPPAQAASPPAPAPASETPAATSAPASGAPGATSAPPPPAGDDPLSGQWSGRFSMEGMPPELGRFTLDLRLAADGQVSGDLSSQMSAGPIADGKFDAATNKLTFSYTSEMGSAEFTAQLAGKHLAGTLEGDGGFSMAFEADLAGPATAGTPAAPAPPAAAAAEQIGQAVGRALGAGRPLGELLPGPRWVSSVEASRFRAGRVYVAFDGHRSDDDEPHLYVSEDYGRTWRSIRGNMPASAGSTRCLREDVVNENLLYVGAEFGAWVSIDRGQNWTRLNSNLPTVAVHDFAIHPTAGEVVVATHGRSLWVLDVTPLRQMSAATLRGDVTLFKPNTGTYWRPEPSRGNGTREFVGRNSNGGVEILYALRQSAESVSLKVTDLAGEVLRTLEAPAQAGLHRVEWDLRRDPPAGAAAGAPPGAARAARAGGGRFRRGGRPVPSGTYVVALSVGNATYTQRFDVTTDPEFPDYRPWELTAEELALYEGDWEDEHDAPLPETDHD